MTTLPSTFPCNTCSITFSSSELQRAHMKQPWHIYNLRRRVNQLPAVSEEEFTTSVRDEDSILRQKQSSQHKSEQLVRGSRSRPDELPEVNERTDATFSTTQCLFCNAESPEVLLNVEHMLSVHSLYIPSREQLSDLDSFLEYLAVIVFEYRECIYCGLEKDTVEGIQSHMRDKGHCMINMTAESELLDFWDFSEDEDQAEGESRPSASAVKLSETEMRLPSGAVINSRSDVAQLRTRPGLTQARTRGSQQRLKRDEVEALTGNEESQPNGESRRTPLRTEDRRIAVRGEMGLIGVPESQRRALQVTEKKMRKREAIAKAAYKHAMEQQPVKTIYYKTENPVYQAG